MSKRKKKGEGLADAERRRAELAPLPSSRRTRAACREDPPQKLSVRVPLSVREMLGRAGDGAASAMAARVLAAWAIAERQRRARPTAIVVG